MERRASDPRSRFQHSQFTRKLHQARNYKRSSRPRPEGKLQASLHKIGLASLLAQIAVATVLILLCYLVYVPNFLYIRSVQLEGMSIEHQTEIEKNVVNYYKQLPWYVPAGHSVFIDSTDLSEYLARNVPAISEVYSASKDFKNRSIIIYTKQKHERYLVIRPEDSLVLYNDGTVKGKMTNQQSGIPQSGAVVTIVTNDISNVSNTDLYLEPQLLELVENSSNKFTANTGQSFMYFNIQLTNNNDQKDKSFKELWPAGVMEAVVQKTTQHGRNNVSMLRIILDPSMDVSAAAERLKMLLEQTVPDRYKNLLYADMRLPNRAYLCLINTPCAQDNP